jgi:L-ascorbate metabolism protein UlaG (beta-lactamase superfamily)
MDRFAQKQAEINAQKTAATRAYPWLWQQMLSDWSASSASDQAWLIYSANYLFRTCGTRWALDPLLLRQRLPSAPEVDISSLAALDYVLLTHRHADHLDLNLLRQLKEFPTRWIVPEFLLASLNFLNLPVEKLIIPHPLTALHLEGLTLVPFSGLHYEPAPDYPDGQRGLPAMGYLAEFNGKRWLLPGDTRSYQAGTLPTFGPVDGIFAHLWLGRGCALQDEPPLSAAFCRFCLDLSPRRIVLTHLNEFGRDADDFWDQRHAQKIKDLLQGVNSRLDVAIAQMGDKITL